MKKVPIEILDDTVKVFLVGISVESSQFPNIITDPSLDYYIEWSDLFKIRKSIVNRLRDSKVEYLINLADAMEDVFKEINKLR